MVISIITLFPRFFDPIISSSILKRAQDNKKIKFRLINLRDYGIGKHKIVDDRPYGGGTGMILRVDVVDKAIKAAKNKKSRGAGSRFAREAVILLSPKGKLFNQGLAEELSNFDHLILVCGHYEGVDERIHNFIDYEISVGDYILSGGEIPAMLIIDVVARLVPGVLEKEDATTIESFSKGNHGRILEFPQYTRPRTHKHREVPDVLLSGNFKNINKYRTEQALKVTKEKRPDLLTREARP